MYSPHKHSYLQSRSSGVNPRIINRSVNLAREQPTKDERDLEPPLNRLTSNQPCIPITNIDVTRRPLGFGRWAMPKLRRELHSNQHHVVLAAVTSIADLVHNPERGYEAITLRIPDRMTHLLSNADAALRERACLALSIMAELADGREAIVKNKKLLTSLSMLVDDLEAAVRVKAAACIEMIARSWMATDELVEFGFIPILLDCIHKDCEIIMGIHLQTLQSLMYSDDGIEIALENDAYTTFCQLLETHDGGIRAESMKCLRQLLTTKVGKQMAYDGNLLVELNRLLHDERPEVYTSAASVIMFATIKSSAKIKATRIQHMPDRLVQLLTDTFNPSAQIFCVKALTNICEHPEIRKVVSERYFDDLQNMSVGDDEELKDCKMTLMKTVNWQPQIPV